MYIFCDLDTGQVVAWGDNHHAQCGQDPSNTTQVTTPYCLPQGTFDRPVVDIACGWTHNLAVTGMLRVK